MYDILFICYGNICRSPMAEMIFKDLVYKNNKKFLFNCTSKATSMEEHGNPIYPKAKEVLEKNNVTIEKHYANQTKKEDYIKYDLINIYNGDPDNKIKLLMSYTNREEEIEDPWYTGNFEKVFNQIKEGCECLFDYLVDESHSEEN